MYPFPGCHYFWSIRRLQVLEVAVYQIQITPFTTLSILTQYLRNKLRNDYCNINWSLANCLMRQMCLLSVIFIHVMYI